MTEMWPDLNMLGRLIVTERRLKKHTQQQLADEIGITRTYLSQIENGQASNLSYRLARAIAVYLKINPMAVVVEVRPMSVRDVASVRRTLGRLHG